MRLKMTTQPGAQTLTTGQLSFIGLEYRRSAIGSFIELGVGNEGILSAGISLRF